MEKHTGNHNVERVRRYREHAAAKGLARCEVQIPEQDRNLIRSLAKLLKEGGKSAHEARQALANLIPGSKQNIVEFFQQSPLSEYSDELDFSRDSDTGKYPDFS